ncbi:MAG: hypothetical protein KBG28_11670 [Kofleriaceae bacterium]|nr:hypothetical protein [Kofleriaceae bacterium]MBP6839324.1 hypothetical protein [Kofleriaceae bacterium]MBP9204616.1 hypothetical protein [Kofleriaceae bacterium]
MFARPLTSLIAAIALAVLVVAGAGPVAPAQAETIEGPGYAIELTAPTAPRAGQAARARVTIRPRAGWKLNQEYPFKVELNAAPALGVTAGVLPRGAARVFTEGEISFDVVVTPRSKGTHRLEGRIKFATCTDTTCDPQKASFVLPIVVP